MRLVERTGHVYGRLLVTGRAGARRGASGRSIVYWSCLCECGSAVEVSSSNLQGGVTMSCGCLQRERATETNLGNIHGESHGLSRHPLYMLWAGMMTRCYNPNAAEFERYGGRGITVFSGWHDVRVFIDFMEAVLGPRPETPEGYERYWSLDRIDNDGNYEPGNVRWADPVTQAGNRRTGKRST